MLTTLIIIATILIILIGIGLSYNGNPIRGYIGLWCTITKHHEKKFAESKVKRMYVCPRCKGGYWCGNVTVLPRN